MALDPEILKKLLEVFKLEFAEQLQVITDGLLELEKKPDDQELLNVIFRAAHTIKGSSRSVGIESIGEIAHALENLFGEMRDEKLTLTPDINDACLAAVDAMRQAMKQFEKKSDQPFDTSGILAQLNEVSAQKKNEKKTARPGAEQKESPKPPSKEKSSQYNIEIETSEYLSVSVDKINDITAISDSIQSNIYFLDAHQKQLVTLRKIVRNLVKENVDLSSELPIRNIYQILDGMDYETRSRSNELFILAQQMQEHLQEVRLVPSVIILRPLARLVRDISRELGKEIEFKTLGSEIEIDRAIVEYLKAPLLHLVRNAIDHGIESPEERKTQGKPKAGKIEVSVSHVSGNVRIILSDDGRGIDLNRVGQLAVEKSLVTQAELDHLTEEEIYQFLLHPGFSTAKQVTDISGRGVGLDVVQSNIHQAKGKIKIESTLGKGTRVIIDVPLSLSADRGTWIRLGRHLFIIPTFSIVRLMKANSKEIRTISDDQVIIFEEQPIILRDLAKLLKIDNGSASKLSKRFVVVIEKSQKQVAFLVDEVIGEEEIIIKSLLPPLSALNNVTGASLTSRGEIVMILDPADLIAMAYEKGQLSTDQVASEPTSRMPKILVVDDSITTRTMEVGILQSEGYEVYSAVNGQEALRRLNVEAFDMVVSDIDMPIMTGFELTEKIKNDPALQHIKVIIVSSHEREEDRRKGIEVKADAYIIKSKYEGKALLDAVKDLMKRTSDG